jgi:hypothetical protein
MLKIASTEPIRLGLHFTTWSLSKLRDYYLKEAIVESISVESIRGILKAEGMLLAAPPQNSVVLSFDEKGNILGLPSSTS